MFRYLHRVLLQMMAVFLLLSLAISQTASRGSAQPLEPAWDDFFNLSGSPTASTYPAIAGDTQGRVHVIWSEDVGGETENILYDRDGNALIDSRGKAINYLIHDGNTLYYSFWDGESWLPPMDIQMNPTGSILYPRLEVDSAGMLHAVWVGSAGDRTALYYSRVFSSHATNVREWTKPTILAEDLLTAYYPVDIAAGANGELYLLYSRYQVDPGIYFIYSQDGGKSWSDPLQIFRTYDELARKEGASTLRLAVDAADRLHATWTRYDAGGNGKAIYYSNSEDSGRTWSAPFEAASWQPGWYETDWLVAGGAGDEIHLVWEGSADIAATYERVSQDGGRTWSQPRWILPKLVGENGFASLVVDSSDTLHLLIVKRGDPDSIAHGIWHSSYRNNQWSEPVLVGSGYDNLYEMLDPLDQPDLLGMMQGTFTGGGLRYQDAVVVNGNELFVVIVNEYDGDVWVNRAMLDAPYRALQAYAEPTPTATPTQKPASSGEIPTTPLPAIPLDPQPSNTQANNGPARVVLFAAIPSLLLILVMIAFVRAARRT